jgi:hypothetical protein
VDAQHYLRSFNAENPIHGLWDYYFEWSVAVGLQLVPRQVKDGERVRTVL